MTNTKALIMRRVYYSFFLRLLTAPMLWQGIVLGACLYLLGRLTHVASIMHNLGATSISNAPNFILNAFTHALGEGQILTILVVLLLAMLTLKFSLQIMTALVRVTSQPHQVS